MKYHDITPQVILNILHTKNINKEYINTLERRFSKKNIYIDSIIKEIYKAKGIDIRLDILRYRREHNLINSYYYDQSKRSILRSKVINGKTKWN